MLVMSGDGATKECAAHVRDEEALRGAQGVGAARRLHIHAAAAAGGGAVSREAKQLWGWAQAEGGAYWNYSQHEIAEMLEPGAALDPQLETLRTRRCASANVFSPE